MRASHGKTAWCGAFHQSQLNRAKFILCIKVAKRHAKVLYFVFDGCQLSLNFEPLVKRTARSGHIE